MVRVMRSKSENLLRALRQLIPDGNISVIHERPWHSLTFSGIQSCITITLQTDDHVNVANKFARDLPDHQFNLGKQLIADIEVIQQTADQSQSRLMVDALILDD
jgi:hypothetical protein